MTYKEAEIYLEKIGQYVEGTGVERGRELLGKLNNPENSLKIIHVAGTNGKGSVCAYLSEILMANGYRVGLFTSPHLLCIRERIQINRRMIAEEEFAKGVELVWSLYEQEYREGKQPLAYFDYFFGVAMDYFKKNNVDYVVMETGLGGRLDATNAIECPIISIITTISLEHTALLGDTVEKIATEKAGIIKAGVPVVYASDTAADHVIKEAACTVGSKSVPVSDKDYKIVKNLNGHIDFLVHNSYYLDDCFQLGSCGVYQVQNATLALTACGVLSEAGVIKINMDKLHLAVKNMKWPGRMEQIAPGIYVDGAHNPQGINAFVQSVNSMYEYGNMDPATLIFSVVSDKNYSQMVSALCNCPHFERFFVTVTGGSRALNKEVIVEEFKGKTDRQVIAFESVEDAFGYADINRNEGCFRPIFVTGSLYLVSDLKRELNKKEYK
ncbi:MAG: bifunctional folylpolyglutamate synthase/dihydrofolate synthase [Lachnospira sp.]